MSILIPCPGCRFLFRADDEFAGESAACPYCGANIVVPDLPCTKPSDRIAASGLASHRLVIPASREEESLPLERRLSHLRRDEDRPPVPLEPDEDRPPRPGALQEPPGPRTQAVTAFLSGIFCCLLYLGVAIWHFDEQPYQASVVGLCGCYFFLWGVLTLRAMWNPKRSIHDGHWDEESSYHRPIGTAKVNFWNVIL